MSGKISAIQIEGFKKFQNFDMKFNPDMNILIGENEAGKSTILEAIRLVLNQDYSHADHSILDDLFNVTQVKMFKKHPCIENLPAIVIDLFLNLDPNDKDSQFYYGENNSINKEGYGISFTCTYDVDQWNNSVDWNLVNEVPVEFYTLKWQTFSGDSYNPYKRPIHFLALDTSRQDRTYSFNYYNKTCFGNVYDETDKLKIKNSFRNHLNSALQSSDIDLSIDEKQNRSFGIDGKKVILENIISIKQNDVPLENHGSGMESMIKTEISLGKSSKSDVIMMEEPENHLSFPNLLKMIEMIEKRENRLQIIIATHSSMIASRLNITKVFWITDTNARALHNLSEDDAAFFCRLPNNNLLQMILAKKVILVEGVAEYLLIPEFFKKITGHSLNELNIVVISCNGISYKRYLAIAKSADKKTVVLTDNDKKQSKIDECEQFNGSHESLQKIYTEQDLEKWTWEVCLYEKNKQNKQNIQKLVRTLNPHSRIDYNQSTNDNIFINYLTDGKNKAEFAYLILKLDLIGQNEILPPNYVEEAITWLVK